MVDLDKYAHTLTDIELIHECSNHPSPLIRHLSVRMSLLYDVANGIVPKDDPAQMELFDDTGR